MAGSIRSLRSPRSRDSVRSSSAPASRLYPTTSETRIAAIFRVSLIAPAPYPAQHNSPTGAAPSQHRAIQSKEDSPRPLAVGLLRVDLRRSARSSQMRGDATFGFKILNE